MTTKNMDDRRAHLFAAMEGLRDKSVDVSTAKAMCDVGQTIINTAKAEADFARATGSRVASNLIPAQSDEEGTTTRTPHGLKTVSGNVTRHTLK